jgi:O-antigen/teichoic acid export membrane protein
MATVLKFSSFTERVRSLFERWGKRILGVVGTQAVCQLLNGVVAFMLVRILPKDQYAWFTLTASVVTILSAISDSGIGAAMMSLGGPVYQDRTKLSSLIRACLDKLLIMTALASVIAIPLLFWLLLRQGASWQMAALISALAMFPQWMANRTIIFSIVNRLRSEVWNLQVTELAGAVCRSALTAAPWLVGMSHVIWATLATSLATLLQGIMVRKQVRPLIDLHADGSAVAEFSPRVSEKIRHIMPSTVFNCFQANLAVGLLGILSGATQVADIGALNRLSFVANLVGSPMGMLVTPAFARCKDIRRLRRLFGAVFVSYALFFASFAFVCWLKADWILGLLGPKYLHLRDELTVVAVGMGLGGLNGVCCLLNLAKGWVRSLWMTIPISLTAQTIAMLLLDMKTVMGAACLTATLCAAHLLYSCWVSCFHLVRDKPSDLS